MKKHVEIRHLAMRTYRFQNKRWFEERLLEVMNVVMACLRANFQAGTQQTRGVIQ